MRQRREDLVTSACDTRSYLVIVHQREHMKDQRARGTLYSQEPQKHWGDGIPGGEGGRMQERHRNVLRVQTGSAHRLEKQVEVKWNL